MMGTTGLKQLRVDCIVGIHPHERQQTQMVTIDIELDYDFGSAATSDAIGDVVDYDRIAGRVAEFIQTRRFHLIETMAEQTAAMILDDVPALSAVRLEIRKPAAVPAAECSFVRIARTRR